MTKKGINSLSDAPMARRGSSGRIETDFFLVRAPRCKKQICFVVSTKASSLLQLSQQNVGRRAARWRVSIYNNICLWGGSISHGNKIFMGIVPQWTHDSYVLPHLRQKSGDAVAQACVAPMRLHWPICNAGINTSIINACKEQIGEGGLMDNWRSAHFVDNTT